MRGCDSFSRDVVVGSGMRVSHAVAAALFSWEIHRRAGLDVTGESPRLRGKAILRWRLGPLRIPAPVEITEVLSGNTGGGFTYRALPGHPEEGEETFFVTIDEQDRVVFRITVRSRPATWWARLGAPVLRRVQRRITDAYLSAAVDVGSEVGQGPGSAG